MRPLWFDGAIVPPERATVSVLAHGVHRGCAVFDFGTFHPTPRGTAVFRGRDHVVRFRRSARLLGLELAHDDDALLAATAEVVRASGLSEGFLRWVALVTTSEPDLVPRTPRATVAIAAYVSADAYAPGEVPPPKTESLRVSVFDDARKAPPEVFPPLAKVGAAYAGPMIAKRRARAKGADEVVLLDVDGDVAEGPTSNVFVVQKGALVTPPLGRILDGITRDSVIALARAEKIEVREERLPKRALLEADEAFLTASSFPIMPISAVNGRPLPAGAPGELTRRLKALLQSAERGEDARFHAWTR